MLEIAGLTVTYGGGPVLDSVSLVCRPNEVVAIIGPNGAGKTTLLRTISGLKRGHGRITWNASAIDHASPAKIVAGGISHVPEGRQLFPPLSVRENLRMGGLRDWRRNRARFRENWDVVCALFPVLAERLDQQAGSLSGGEQQMLAIGRALMNSPSLLMLDEPSLGLAPIVIENIYRVLFGLRERGLSMIIVEARPEQALQQCDRMMLLANGRVLRDARPAELTRDDQLQSLFGFVAEVN
jgi:branched-chain amino acid transport system ATP-binding protein